MVRAAVMDLGIGNLFSVVAGLRRAGCDVELTSPASALESYDLIVLPGVGSFDAAVEKIEPLRVLAKDQAMSGKLIFGICLGYQLLFERSDEGGGMGLGFFRGYVRRLPKGVRIPHIGWNTVNIVKWHELLEGLKDGNYFYFAHSFYPTAEEDDVCAFTDYGARIPSVAAKGNVIGVQFHPEKSGETGGHLLRNLVRLVRT